MRDDSKQERDEMQPTTGTMGYVRVFSRPVNPTPGNFGFEVTDNRISAPDEVLRAASYKGGAPILLVLRELFDYPDSVRSALDWTVAQYAAALEGTKTSLKGQLPDSEFQVAGIKGRAIEFWGSALQNAQTPPSPPSLRARFHALVKARGEARDAIFDELVKTPDQLGLFRAIMEEVVEFGGDSFALGLSIAQAIGPSALEIIRTLKAENRSKVEYLEQVAKDVDVRE